MFRSCAVILVAAASAFCASARAEQSDLQPLVQVTASRVPETVDDSLADVSVITREDLDTIVARDVLDVLRLQPGIDIYRTGGAGQQTSISIRGSNSNQVLVLIDGVRVAAATTGAFAFEQLPLDSIERIEIVRGPRASYWGSDAIGGVIQIFTRKLQGPLAAIGYGSWNEAVGSAGIGQWEHANGYSVQVGARHVSGFSATNPTICNGPDDPYCSYNPDTDGFRNASATVRAAHQFGSQVLSGSVLRSQGQSQFDQGYSNAIEQVAGINLDGALGPDWSHHFSAGYVREDLSTPAFNSQYTTRRSSLLWQNEIRIAPSQRLIAGLEFVHEQGQTRDTFSDTARYLESRDNRAVFGGWRADLGSLDSELSVRHDDNSVFGGATTGSAALGWRVAAPLRVVGSIGQGFRSPSMNDLYDPGYGGTFAGNPDLQPERSNSAELGLEFTPSMSQRFGLNVYSTRVSDLISFTGPDNQAENIARANLRGAELTWQLDVGAWSTQATWTWLDPRNSDTGKVLIRRARKKGSVVVQRSFGERLTVGAEFIGNGPRADVGGVQLAGYGLVNLRGNYQLGQAWTLSARLENLTDRQYELVHGYNTPGRSAFLELIWQPKR